MVCRAATCSVQWHLGVWRLESSVPAKGLATVLQVAAGSAGATEKAIRLHRRHCKLCWLCGCLQALPQTVAMPPGVRELKKLTVQQGLAMLDKIQDSNAKASLPDGPRVNIPRRRPCFCPHIQWGVWCAGRCCQSNQQSGSTRNQQWLQGGQPAQGKHGREGGV